MVEIEGEDKIYDGFHPVKQICLLLFEKCEPICMEMVFLSQCSPCLK